MKIKAYTSSLLLIVAALYITGCADPNNANTGGGTSPESARGAYWGKMTVQNAPFDMAVVVRADTLAVYSSADSGSGTYQGSFSGSGTNLSFASSSKDGRENTSVTAAYDGSAWKVTIAMGPLGRITSENLSKGGDYDQRWGTGKVGDKLTYYGSYYGTITVMNVTANIALVVKESGITLYQARGSTITGTDYPGAFTLGSDGKVNFASEKKNATQQSISTAVYDPTAKTWTYTLAYGQTPSTSSALSLKSAYNGSVTPVN